jgi:hypothetical protein
LCEVSRPDAALNKSSEFSTHPAIPKSCFQHEALSSVAVSISR